MNRCRNWRAAAAIAVAVSSWTGASALSQHKHVSDEELLNLLKDAAPASVFAGATVLNMAPDGTMKVVREGNNGWTCMDPSGTDPMCADAGGMEWGKAYMTKGPAPQRLGFIYMLRGDNGASNTDPYATGETPDNNWIKTGSHVMIVGAEAKSMIQSYPRSPKADPTKPYVMWAGTPYEHLMLPVK
ncbi:hypothetical protein ABEG18_05860 [Alsobacter sp. KACC 23698]|uniref:Uncharacterized protein n=1 Tax=Alsobacter sp. KACC 23698 TaxID=3149229 RepID=A0AAU7JJ14_9HYPH